MQKDHLLYLKRKQSQYLRFRKHSISGHFEDWESDSEYDTDIENELIQLTDELEARITALHTLEQQQPLEEETAQIVQLVVPVSAAMPAPQMEIDNAPLTTMGPGQVAADDQLPPVFTEGGMEEDDGLLEDYMEETDEAGPVVVPAAGLFQHPMDPVDEGDFDDAKEQQLIDSLIIHHGYPVMWCAQFITIWKQLVETAAEANQQDPTNPQTVKEQYPKLFQYLVEGGPDSVGSVLTQFEAETGRADMKDTINGCAVIYMAAYEREMGCTDLEPALEAFILAGEETEELSHEAKLVPRDGVPVLYFEKGLLQTILERADYGESDLFASNHTLFLRDLTDQEVYNQTILLEQVTDLVRRKGIKDLPEIVWATLRDFEFGEGEEAVRMLREYLESANGRNTSFLEQLRQEGIQRHQLQDLNEVGGALPQAKPIPSSAILLRHMLVLIASSGAEAYSEGARKEAERIQEERAKDAQKIYFTLHQPDEEAN